MKKYNLKNVREEILNNKARIETEYPLSKDEFELLKLVFTKYNQKSNNLPYEKDEILDILYSVDDDEIFIFNNEIKGEINLKNIYESVFGSAYYKAGKDEEIGISIYSLKQKGIIGKTNYEDIYLFKEIKVKVEGIIFELSSVIKNFAKNDLSILLTGIKNTENFQKENKKEMEKW